MVSSKFLQLIKELKINDIRIEASSGLTSEEIEKMKDEANAELDKLQEKELKIERSRWNDLPN
jgi:molecular chaperone DnaK (HSP70)